MIVKVSVQGKEIKVNVGDGKQTFKWLASVVQARIAQYDILKTNYEENSYIVTEIRNYAGELLDPSDCLFEHAGPQGLSVAATVNTSFPIDDWENPDVGEWMKAAYIKSEIGQHWATEMDAWRDSLRKVKSMQGADGISSDSHLNNLIVQRALPPPSNMITIGYNFSESDILSAFDLDWGAMKWRWLRPTDHEKSAIGDALKRNYSLVCNLFAHYCGVGQVGQRYGMTVHEFGHLLHFARTFNLNTDESLIEDIFHQTMPNTGSNSESKRVEAKDDGAGVDGRWPLMTRAHFTEAIVGVVQSKMKKEESSSLVEALVDFLAEDISKLWSDISTNYLFYTTGDEVLKKSTIEYYQLLRRSFGLKATVDSRLGPRLSVSALVDMLTDAGIAEAQEQETTVVASFLDTQLNPPVIWELKDMVFVEFMEAISRISLKVIDSYSKLTDAKRIRMVFNIIAGLYLDGKPSHK